MATERLPMRSIRESIRLKWLLRRSHRETARSVGVSSGAVGSVLCRAAKKGLSWDAVTGIGDEALEQLLYGPKLAAGTPRSRDFIVSRTRAVEFFGGVSALFIPDQLRSAVTIPCRYEPGVQRTYQDLGAAPRHRGPAGAPAQAPR